MKGNTAVYLNYAFVRIQAVKRRLKALPPPSTPIRLTGITIPPSQTSVGVLLKRRSDLLTTVL
jgi:hypothetical protein